MVSTGRKKTRTVAHLYALFFFLFSVFFRYDISSTILFFFFGLLPRRHRRATALTTNITIVTKSNGARFLRNARPEPIKKKTIFFCIFFSPTVPRPAGLPCALARSRFPAITPYRVRRRRPVRRRRRRQRRRHTCCRRGGTRTRAPLNRAPVAAAAVRVVRTPCSYPAAGTSAIAIPSSAEDKRTWIRFRPPVVLFRAADVVATPSYTVVVAMPASTSRPRASLRKRSSDRRQNVSLPLCPPPNGVRPTAL